MAQTIKLKRSATQNAVPTTSQLELGEVAINTYDGKMYIKKNDGSDSIVEIGGDATSSSGLDFTGNLNLEDNVRIVIGDGNDLQIYHDGSNSYISDQGTGNLFVQGTNLVLEDAGGANYLTATSGEAVRIFHNASKKFETTSSGISVTGNIGIDEDSPNYTIHAKKAMASTPSNVIYLEMSGTNANGGGGALRFDTSASNSDESKFYASIEGVRSNSSDGSNELRFFTAKASTGTPTQRMVIDEDGNVGIGTTSPTKALDVVGRGAFSDILHVSKDIQHPVGTGQWKITNKALNAYTRFAVTDSNGTETNVLNIRPNGNVGIGTASTGLSPTATLDVYNATAETIAKFTSGDNRARIHIKDDDTDVYVIAEGSKMSLGAANSLSSTNLTIDSSGNVGIGTTSPTKSFHLNYNSSSTSRTTGNGFAGGTAGDGFLIQNSNAGNNTYANLDFRAATADGRIVYQYTGTQNQGDFHFITDNTNSPATAMTIKNDGKVGIGTTSPSYHFHVDAGNSNTTAFFESDGVANVVVSGGTNRGSFVVQHSGTTSGALIAKDGGGLEFGVGANYATNVGMTLDSSGNLSTGQVTSDERFTVSTSDWYQFTPGTMSATAGSYGMGNGNNPSLRQLTFHVPNIAAYSNTGTVPSFGWYSNGADLLMKLESSSGNLNVKGNISTDSNATLIATRKLAARDTNGLAIATSDGTERIGVLNSGAVRFNNAFVLPTAIGSAGQVLKVPTSGTTLYWATEAAASIQASIADADGDTKIQVEESADEDKIRFDTAGTERAVMSANNTTFFQPVVLEEPSPHLILKDTTDDDDHQISFRDNGNSDVFKIDTGGDDFNFSAYGSFRDIRFRTNDTERVRITAGGFVGIGTASPTDELTVDGSIKATTAIGINSDPEGYLSSIGARLSVGGNVVINNNNPLLYLRANSTTNASDFRYQYALRFTNGAGTEALRIDSSNNLGIGTTSPTSKLEVHGTTTLKSQLDFLSPDGTDTISASMLNTDTLSFTGDSGQLFSITDSSSGTIFSVNDISGVPSIEVEDDGTIRLAETFGNVGIGLETPSKKLDVSGDFQVATSTSSTAAYIRNSGTGTALVVNQQSTGDILRVDDNSTTKLVVKDGGNVGIGTSSPSRLLDIAAAGNDGIRISSGNALIGGGASGGDAQLIYWNGSTAYYGRGSLGGSVSQHEFRTGGTTRVTIKSDGKVGIGTISPGRKLTIVGGSGDNLPLRVVGGSGTNHGSMEFQDPNTTADYKVTIGSKTDDFYIQAGGSEKVRFASSGNVGIGDSSPDFKLSIRTPAIPSGSTYAWPLDLSRPNTDNRGLSFGIGTSGGPHAIGAHNGHITLGQTFGTDSNSLPQFYETMRVWHNGTAAAGRVGILTTLPATPLHVGGTIRSQAQGSSAFADYKNQQIYVNSGPFNIAVNGKIRLADQNNNPVLTVDNANDRVGIGVDSPATNLEVAGSAPKLRITDTRDQSFTVGDIMSSIEFDSDDTSGGAGSSSEPRAAINMYAASTFGSSTGLSFHTKSDVTTYPTKQMVITNVGRVGIATDSPSDLLHVVGTIRSEGATTSKYLQVAGGNSGNFIDSYANDLFLRPNGTTGQALVIRQGGATEINGTLRVQAGDAGTSAYSITSNGGDLVLKAGADDVVLRTGGSGSEGIYFQDGAQDTKMFINAENGQVGIGTTSPSYNLDIQTTTGTGLNVTDDNGWATIRVDGGGGTDNVLELTNFGTTGSGSLIRTTGGGILRFAAANTEAMRINANGNVAIGGSFSGANGKLCITESTANIASAFHTDGTSWLRIVPNLGTDGYNALSVAGDIGLIFSIDNNVASDSSTQGLFIGPHTNSSTNGLKIQENGNIGIGTNSPSEKLHVAGDVRIDGSTNSSSSVALLVGGTGNGTIKTRHIDGKDFQSTSDGALHLNYSVSDNVSIARGGGKVQIGSGVPLARLQVEEAGIDTLTTATSSTSQVAIDTFNTGHFRSAEFTIQVTNSTTSKYHLTKILLIHDGTTPNITEYGTIFTGTAAEATFDADISGSNVRLLATPASTNSMTFKVVRHCITV